MQPDDRRLCAERIHAMYQLAETSEEKDSYFNSVYRLNEIYDILKVMNKVLPAPIMALFGESGQRHGRHDPSTPSTLRPTSFNPPHPTPTPTQYCLSRESCSEVDQQRCREGSLEGRSGAHQPARRVLEAAWRRDHQPPGGGQGGLYRVGCEQASHRNLAISPIGGMSVSKYPTAFSPMLTTHVFP